MFNKEFQDRMDNSRTVVPVKDQGRDYLCKVFVDGFFMGQAPVPKGLFTDKADGLLGRVGFLLI